MHAFLIIGQTPQDRKGGLEKLLNSRNIEKAPLYRYMLNPLSIADTSTYGIDDVRQLISWICLRHEKPSAAVIEEAERLTKPAQCALLKTLEEPPLNVSIILSTNSEQSLLAPLRSRCHITRVSDGKRTFSNQESQRIVAWIQKLSAKDHVSRIIELYRALSKMSGKTISPHSGAIKREDGQQFVEKIIDALHETLKSQTLPVGPDLSKQQWVSGVLKQSVLVHHRLTKNLNVSLALQQFVFDISNFQIPKRG